MAELFEQECLAFSTATDYSQWEFACQEIAHSAGCPADTTSADLSGCTHMHTVLVYECYEDAGCAADDSDIFYFVGEDAAGAPTWALRDGWRLTRSVGKLVEEGGYTEVSAYEYVDYMSVVLGDFVWVGTTAETAAIFECVDAAYCTYITPSEDWTGAIW